MQLLIDKMVFLLIELLLRYNGYYNLTRIITALLELLQRYKGHNSDIINSIAFSYNVVRNIIALFRIL